MVNNRFIDPGLLRRALNVSGGRSKKAVVERALQEFVARREQKGLLDLFGKFEWDCTDDNLERSRDYASIGITGRRVSYMVSAPALNLRRKPRKVPKVLPNQKLRKSSNGLRIRRPQCRGPALWFEFHLSMS